MKPLLRGERNISLFATLGLIAVAAALIAAWLVTLQVQSSFRSFKANVYGRCLARAKFDSSQRGIYRSLRDYYAHLHSNIQANEVARGKSSTFLLRLDVQTKDIVADLNRSLQTGRSQGIGDGQRCAQYKP